MKTNDFGPKLKCLSILGIEFLIYPILGIIRIFPENVPTTIMCFNTMPKEKKSYEPILRKRCYRQKDGETELNS